MPETSVIVGASLAVHFFSPRPAVDHVVACLTCRNAAEQSFVCQHGGAPWPTVHEVPGGSSPELVPGGLHPQRISLPPLPSRSSEPLVRLMVKRLAHA